MILILLLAAATPAQATATPSDQTVFGTAQALDAGMLAGTTAREDVSQVALADQAATVSNNSVQGNSVTGSASLDGNAFQGSSGLTIVSVNTGNNVAINSALNVNITFSPAP